MLEQFKALIDPSTALGAFLISFFAGVVTSFLGGFFSGKAYEKKNIQKVKDNHGNMYQDCKIEQK